MTDEIIPTPSFEVGRLVPVMSLRDYFAAQALVGFMTHPNAPDIPAEDAPKLASDCYAMADAMLKARDASPRPIGVTHLGDGPQKSYAGRVTEHEVQS